MKKIMEKYLYLTKVEWVDAWINGGEIPIALASTYFRKERDGIYTPDENQIHESPTDLTKIPILYIPENAMIENSSMWGNTINGVKLPEFLLHK